MNVFGLENILKTVKNYQLQNNYRNLRGFKDGGLNLKSIRIRSPYRGSGSITREQFLFFETRTTAKLLVEGLSDEEIMCRIIADNLFQYPTEKSVKQMARTCLKRLHGLKDNELVHRIIIN